MCSRIHRRPRPTTSAPRSPTIRQPATPATLSRSRSIRRPQCCRSPAPARSAAEPPIRWACRNPAGRHLGWTDQLGRRHQQQRGRHGSLRPACFQQGRLARLRQLPDHALMGTNTEAHTRRIPFPCRSTRLPHRHDQRRIDRRRKCGLYAQLVRRGNGWRSGHWLDGELGRQLDHHAGRRRHVGQPRLCQPIDLLPTRSARRSPIRTAATRNNKGLTVNPATTA